jgi:hypothetical protein
MAAIRYARQHGAKRLWLVHVMARRPIMSLPLTSTQNGEGADEAIE